MSNVYDSFKWLRLREFGKMDLDKNVTKGQMRVFFLSFQNDMKVVWVQKYSASNYKKILSNPYAISFSPQKHICIGK